MTLDYRTDEPRIISTDHARGRLPCMVATSALRTVTVNLRTQEILHSRLQPVPLEPNLEEQAIQRYGAKLPPRPETDDPLQWVEWYMEMAKQIFAVDKWHAETVFLFSPNGHHSMLSFIPEDQQTKYMFMNDVAAEVERFGHTGLVLIADTWYVREAELPEGQRPGDSASRKEALTVYAARSDGETRTLMTPYVRRDDEVEFGPTYESHGGEYFLAPVMRVWGLDWPSTDARTDDRDAVRHATAVDELARLRRSRRPPRAPGGG